VGLFLLGPAAGIAAGIIAIRLLEWFRRRFGVRRDYESLYALGVAFTAYATAEALGGSGFLAAFAAGLMIAAIDVELCDCFLDYGEATAEMFLLLTFLAFGASLIWSGIEVLDPGVLVFAAIALLIRTAVLYPVLRWTGIDEPSRRIVALFGPRGLSSLLLILLPVFAGIAGSERLFAICCSVVLLSLVLHGSALAIFARTQGRAAAPTQPTGAPVPVPTTPVEPSAERSVADSERITLEELRQLWERGEPVVVLDVRTDRAYGASDAQAHGAVRLPPDDAVLRAAELSLPRHAWLVAYCA
jgi:sodium/hydrogen antiporter